MATPFSGKIFNFTQPDGSQLEVRGWGDQYFARFETMDGYTVTKNPHSGFWEIAQLSPGGNRLEPVSGARAAADGGRSRVERGVQLDAASARVAGRDAALRFGGRRCDQRRQERRQQKRILRGMAAQGLPVLAPPQRTTVGDYFGLCLLIDFDDAPGTISPAEVENFCNQCDYKGFGNNGSVHDYFFDNSLGRLRYKNIVTPYYRARFPKTYYTDPAIPIGTRARELIGEALTHWLAEGFDFSQLTADDESLVYATNVFYAGDVVNNWSEGLWPHAWMLGTPVTLAPGKASFDYQVTALGSELELGTFCHENGHMLCDYPDLYDYGPESTGVGAFCLMCLGGNANPKNPANISAYLKRLSGWARHVDDLAHCERVHLTAGHNTFAIHAKNDEEYFLVEHRSQTRRDAVLPDAGLAIWHVDELGSNSNEQMTNESHYELSLEQADGLFELEHAAGQFGDSDDLFGRRMRFGDTTTPDSKWWDGTASHLFIDKVTVNGDKASFRCTFPKDRKSAPEIASSQLSSDGE